MSVPPPEIPAVRKSLDAEGIEWQPFAYTRFGLSAVFRGCRQLLTLLGLCRSQGIATIHCFGSPSGVLGTLLSVLTGIPLVIDSYEPHAEVMVETGTWRPGSAAFRILSFFERVQSRRATAVIATTARMREYALARYGVRHARFFVKPSCVNLGFFARGKKKDPALANRYGLSGKLVCVYAGKTGGLYLGRELFDLLKVARDLWGERFMALLLTSDPPDVIKRYCLESGLPDRTVVSRFVDYAEIPEHIGLGDFGVSPVKPVHCREYIASIKNSEYWATGLPVVTTTSLGDDAELIRTRGLGSVLTELSPASYRQALTRIDRLFQTNSPDELYSKIRRVAEECRGFDQAETPYRELYGARSGGPAGAS